MAKHMRGAIMSPLRKRMMARPHQLRSNVPTSFAMVPSQLSEWLNDTDGDCVTAEEAFAKGAYSVFLGLPDLFVPDAVVLAWATKGKFLNGAVLTDVMDAMIKSGFPVNGVTYNDGPYESVDYTNWATLTSAISTGPVKIGVDAQDIQDAVNTTSDASGWFGTGWKDGANQDHCVSLCGYGTVTECYQFLGIPIPSAAQGSAGDEAVLLYTWKSIGVVLFPSMVAVASEAWIRTPTTPGLTPGPTPTPTPNTISIPATAGWWDKPSAQIHVPTGWTAGSNNLNPEVIIHPNNQVVNVPTVGVTKWTEV